jgi:hypothetical protein
MCVRGAWPAENPTFDGIDDLRFLSAAPGAAPGNLRLFAVETRPMREGVRGGLTSRTWCDSVKAHMREDASRNRSLTVTIRPQVLAKHDPKLVYVCEIVEHAPAIGMAIGTLRDRLKLESA